MLSGIPAPTGSKVTRTVFYANSAAAGVGWQTYTVPPNASMLYIFLLAGGGGGGLGRIGPVLNSGGGGGGGSSSQTTLTVPAFLLSPTLFLSIGYGGAGATLATASTAGIQSRISVYPDTTADHCVAVAGGGTGGGTTTATAGGTGGAGGAVATTATMPLGFTVGVTTVFAGQTGIVGGAGDSTGGALTLPTTGLVVTGGTGGGGLRDTGESGRAGGAFTTPANSLFFPPQIGGIFPTATTTPPGNGSNGINFVNDLNYFYGGTGGASTHGSATGAGAVQSFGGAGGYGCGGGGSGAALTGSTAGGGGGGGGGLAIIYAW